MRHHLNARYELPGASRYLVSLRTGQHFARQPPPHQIPGGGAPFAPPTREKNLRSTEGDECSAAHVHDMRRILFETPDLRSNSRSGKARLLHSRLRHRPERREGQTLISLHGHKRIERRRAARGRREKVPGRSSEERGCHHTEPFETFNDAACAATGRDPQNIPSDDRSRHQFRASSKGVLVEIIYSPSGKRVNGDRWTGAVQPWAVSRGHYPRSIDNSPANYNRQKAAFE